MSFLYYDELAGTFNITTGNDAGPTLTNPSALSFTVSAGTANKLIFTTSPVTVMVGVLSDTITVQRQDSWGNAITAEGNRTVTLSTTSRNGIFRDTGDAADIASVTINSGGSTASLKYKDTTAGSPTITAASSSPTTITEATQVEMINALAASVTPATGGGAISADTANGAYTSLTGPVLDEGNNRDIDVGTIVLNAPSGFQFDTSEAAAVTVAVSRLDAGTEAFLTLSSGTATVTSSTITITVSARDSSAGNTKARSRLTWSGIKVRPTAGTPLASGNITNSGMATIAGVAAGSNFGTLTEVLGAASRLVFTTSAQTLTVGVVSGTMTVQRQDQFNSPNTSDSTITVNLTSGSTGGVFRNTANTANITSVQIANGSSSESFLYSDTV
ncbi:MAG: hypothetical protein Q7R41_02865, partial [Phycisphaerales bacterium]|nr:hypothetical protein [Phycisphaerales bacterium]